MSVRYGVMARSTALKFTTALVVENEAVQCLELGEYLAEMGMAMLRAHDADEAVALLEAYPQIALLLTDIRMPGVMDGIQLARHVQGRWPRVKIVIASGMIGTRFSDLPPGSLFLSKPYWPEDIKRALSYMIWRMRGPTASASVSQV